MEIKTMGKTPLLSILICSLCFFPSFSAFAGGPDKTGKNIVIEGTLVHNELEGGFFTIQDQDGKIYVPINLPEKYAKDGLQVRVKAIPSNDVGGIHMVGEYIEIVTVEDIGG